MNPGRHVARNSGKIFFSGAHVARDCYPPWHHISLTENLWAPPSRSGKSPKKESLASFPLHLFLWATCRYEKSIQRTCRPEKALNENGAGDNGKGCREFWNLDSWCHGIILEPWWTQKGIGQQSLQQDIQVTLREEIKSACEYRPFEKCDYIARISNEICRKKMEYVLEKLDGMKETIDEFLLAGSSGRVMDMMRMRWFEMVQGGVTGYEWELGHGYCGCEMVLVVSVMRSLGLTQQGHGCGDVVRGFGSW
ncbi:mediator of RNA polymerase II transcription subunit 11, partial [Tanacetum coccineum]